MLQRSHRVFGVLTMTVLTWMGMPGGSAAQQPGTVVERDARVQGHTYVFEETGEEMPYALFLPADYDAAREWPLIVALHGLGRPYDWMMGYDGFIDFAERYGYIVVSPLGYSPRGWYGSRTLPENLGELSEKDVMNVLEITRDRFRVDESRVYLWGHGTG